MLNNQCFDLIPAGPYFTVRGSIGFFKIMIQTLRLVFVRKILQEQGEFVERKGTLTLFCTQVVIWHFYL